ncbi:hypothetical protein GobsT_30500 [Gemmata obscuriglobus]|uniref:Uncharacterized protein n=1 Tax=Gemmata obscuriglobus TaxID=114 RepID=A0A2Z3H1M8_9BACT|nr:hypothetical protein [Gemmata obscuriglobus]AWM38751.1 hypothetical protein C1280_18340 [Gemmata obscuriglobus]QEG28274.1 hypothetical protein GobsT_30500 [Gemmata obscuriglobus]VTS06083.1 unnamed protein product [Gemmata obscuriglobus UQM 2246]
MRKFVPLVLVGGCARPTQPNSWSDELKGDAEALQGVWAVISAEDEHIETLTGAERKDMGLFPSACGCTVAEPKTVADRIHGREMSESGPPPAPRTSLIASVLFNFPQRSCGAIAC